MNLSLVAQARIEGHDSQQVFDALLHALAEPGTIRRLPSPIVAVELPTPLWLALSLADVDTSVSVVGTDAPAWSRLVHDATNAPVVDPADAWIIVALPGGQTALDQARIGTDLAPEDGARIALPVDDLIADVDRENASASGAERGFEPNPRGQGRYVVTLAGPGVAGRCRLGIDGIDRRALERVGRASGSFPTGFDTWLFTADGRVAAIPRSTDVEVEGG